MAVDMFIKIDKIDGESHDKGHRGEIDVLSWSWGSENRGTAGQAGGLGSGKVAMRDLSLVKYIDLATPKLALANWQGTHIASAVLVCRKAGGAPLEYLRYTLSDILVTSVSSGAATHDDRQTETITLNFAKISLDYTPQNEKGTGGKAITVGWDVTKNVAV